MKSFRTAMQICFHNFRKWKHDYRIWLIAILLFLLVKENADIINDLSKQMNVKSSFWLFPFLYTQYHQKLIFTIPLLMLFNNAPFVDENALFIIARCKKSIWHTGQFMYILISSSIYYLYIFLCTIITTFPTAEFTTDWGKCLRTIANTNMTLYAGHNFLTVPQFTVMYFTPLQAVWFTFLLSVLMAVMIGTIIYFFNITTHTKYIGCTVCSIIILFSCFVENFGTPLMRWYSPVTWITVDKLDVGGITHNPVFPFCVTVLCGVSVILAVIILLFRKRLKLDTD